MKANMILSLLVLIVLVSCSKDKFQTKPLIEIKSYNSKTISRGTELRIDINFFDKEGDLGQADFYAFRDRLNVKVLNPSTEDKADTLRYQLAKFPDTDHGEIVFQIGYDFLKESLSQNDTLVFRFAVTDHGGNKSDTITSSKLVILQ
jgi:hypothetical protein